MILQSATVPWLHEPITRSSSALSVERSAILRSISEPLRDYQLAGWEQIRYWPCWAAIAALAAYAAAELGRGPTMAGEDRGTHSPAELRLAAAFLGAWGCYQVIAGLYFIVSRPSFLPEDLRASATTLEAVRSAAPGIEGWLQLVFTVMGGQMAAGGVLVMGGAFSLAQGRSTQRVELGTYVVAGFLSVVLMSGVNFAMVSDFRWLLVAPAILWLSAIIILGRGALGSAARSYPE